MDSKQFRKLAKKPYGMEVFGVWVLLLELAAKMPERGVLKDKDGDLSIEDMELITGFPSKSFEKAIKILCSDEIGWITDDTQQSLNSTPDDTQPTVQYNTIQDSPSLVIDYLNTKANTNYKKSGAKSISLINSRLKEGFTIDDFYKVIDTKSDEWKGDSKMSQYLRPETLFSNKFESYLNQNKSGSVEKKYAALLKKYTFADSIPSSELIKIGWKRNRKPYGDM